MLPLRALQPSTRTPVVTYTLIAACVVAFAAWQPHDPFEQQVFFYERAAIPCELDQGTPLSIQEIQLRACGADGGPEQFPDKNVWLAAGTSLFLHGDWWHLLGNMLFLFVFGRNVEDRIGGFGFLATYLFFGAAALAAHVAFNLGSTVPVVGASGAIAGIMGMYLILWPQSRILTLVMWIIAPIPAWFVLGAWILLQFLTDPNSGIAYVAHIGGFIAGVGVGAIVRGLSRPPVDPGSNWPPDPYAY